MFRQVHLLIPTLTAVLIFLPTATLCATTATTSPAAPTTNPGGAGAAGRAAAGAQPVVKCAWGDLLRVAVHGGKLDVAIKPPPAIAADLMNRKSVDVDIEDAADKSWRLQGVPRRQPGGVIGGRAAPAA
ncbi:MAG: hypothetical protein QOE14_1593, partial [Humisphaera sp.]|nr:hypothetical protein [Humisphaera sp.]